MQQLHGIIWMFLPRLTWSESFNRSSVWQCPAVRFCFGAVNNVRANMIHEVIFPLFHRIFPQLFRGRIKLHEELPSHRERQVEGYNFVHCLLNYKLAELARIWGQRVIDLSVLDRKQFVGKGHKGVHGQSELDIAFSIRAFNYCFGVGLDTQS